MKHKKMSILFFAISFMILATAIAVNAASINDVQNKIDAINAEKAKKIEELNSAKKSLSDITNQVNDIYNQQLALEDEVASTNAKIDSLQGEINKTEELIPVYLDKTNSMLSVLQKNSHNNFLIDSLFSSESSPGESARKAYVSGKLSESAINIVNETIDLKNNLIAQKNELVILQDDLALKQVELEAQSEYMAVLQVKISEATSIANNEVRDYEAEERYNQNLQQLMIDAGCSGDQQYGIDCGQISSTNGFLRPLQSGKVTWEWRAPDYPSHNGIDLGQDTCGGSVYPIANGQVVLSGYTTFGGNMVVVLHNVGGRSMVSVYMHMESAPLVSYGQNINTSTQIGKIGNTGESYGCHLHLGVNYGQTFDSSISFNPREMLAFPPREVWWNGR